MAKKLTSAKAKEILHDKSVHGHPLTEKQRKFFGAIAGGAKPYKAQVGTMLTSLPSNWGDRLSDVLSFPQKAITKLFTGEYQTPSEAMKIQNPVGALAADILLDPTNLLGAGLTAKASGAIDNAYRINPWRFRPNPEAYYHRSPDLANVINPETRMLQGFGESEAGRKLTEAIYNKKQSFGEVPIINLRKGANNKLYFSKGVPLDYGRYNSRSLGMSGQGYKGPFLIEAEGIPMGGSTKGRAPGAAPTKLESYAVSKRPISADEVKFYKEDWLKGYKQVKPPKQKQDGGWLDKYEQGGLVLKQKTHDNYGKKPNANNSDVSLPPGFKGWAYNTKGRNYSPAWGGQFQDGGGITPYSPEYVNTLRNEWVDFYNPVPPINPPARDDKFDQFFRSKKEKLPWKSELKSGWMKQYDDGSSEFREQPKDEPPTKFGKPLKGWSWTDKWEEKSQYGDNELSRLLSNVIINEVRKPESLRDVKFQMGGSMPGAVGFMYARTQSPAPSNGPYAKKTKASAQNGQEMKYYQEGLDFKPKTISQDGSDIPVDSEGYWNPENWGNPVIIPSTDITMEGVYEPLIGISDTGDVQYMEPGEDYEFDGEYVTEYPVAQKGKMIPQATTADSARLYNAQIALNKFYENEIKAGRLKKESATNLEGLNNYINSTIDDLREQNLNFYRNQIKRRQDKGGLYDEEYKNIFNLSPEQVKQLEYKGLGQTKGSSEYQEYYRDIITPLQNLAAPLALVDKRISPQRMISYKPTGGVNDYPGGEVEVFDYDPLAIKPYSMRTEKEKIEWEKKYGKPKPTSTSRPKPKPKPAPKPEPKKAAKEALIEQISSPKETSKPVPPTDYFQGQSVFAPTPYHGSGAGAFVGFKTPQGDTIFVKPEDYDRMAVPKYGREFIESKKKQRNGGVNNADAQPIEKLDQLLNFTNYNKPTKGGWLSKYED